MRCGRRRCGARSRGSRPYLSADLPKILALEPDLVLAFSDLQAGIVAELARAGLAVHVFNQRDIAGILAMIRTVGALVGAPAKGAALAEARRRVAAVRHGRAPAPAAGLFRGMGRAADRRHRLGLRADRDRRRQRRVRQPAHGPGRQGPDRDPEPPCSPPHRRSFSPRGAARRWCRRASRGRPGWEALPAVRTGRIVEIKSPLILQPGPAALTDGLDAICIALA